MSFGAASVTPRSVAMGTLLEENHPFFVPRYQRSYAWENQVSAFTDDIKDLVAGVPDETSHFFGGLVCIEHTDHTQPRPHRYEIVDGQQRLATIVIALAQIMRAAKKIEATAADSGDTAAEHSARTLAEDTQDRFLTWRSANVTAGRTDVLPRLTLSQADDGYFQDILGGKAGAPTRESHELLAAAESHIASSLIAPALSASKTHQESIVELERIRTAIISQSHVILIVSHDRDRAYQLFSVLNDRGRSLEDADLLRSYTLEIVQKFPVPQEKIALIWDDILSSSAKEVSEFFRAYYPSTTGVRTSPPMFKKLREEYFPDGECTTDAEADIVAGKIEEFRDERDVFANLSAGEWPYPVPPEGASAPAVGAWSKDRLRRLIVTLKHELAMPLLLAAARSVDEKTFAQLVYMLEIFAFRYKNVCGGHATAAGNAYYTEAHAVRQKKAAGTPIGWLDLRTRLKALIGKSASDQQFRTSLESRLRYDYGGAQRGNIRELLTTLEEHSAWLATGAAGVPKPDMTMVFDLDQATIEHIYPQNPLAGESDAQLEPVRHHLGNLTFFGPDDNSKAGNRSFRNKKDIYYKPSRIQMTSRLAQLADWDLGAHEARTAQILDDACKVFAL